MSTCSFVNVTRRLIGYVTVYNNCFPFSFACIYVVFSFRYFSLGATICYHNILYIYISCKLIYQVTGYAFDGIPRKYIRCKKCMHICNYWHTVEITRTSHSLHRYNKNLHDHILFSVYYYITSVQMQYKVLYYICLVDLYLEPQCVLLKITIWQYGVQLLTRLSQVIQTVNGY